MRFQIKGTYGNEEVRHFFFIFLPGTAVLLPALRYVSQCPMSYHDHEEYGVKPWEWAIEASYEAP